MQYVEEMNYITDSTTVNKGGVVGYFIHKKNDLSYRSALEMMSESVASPACPAISHPSLETLYIAGWKNVAAYVHC